MIHMNDVAKLHILALDPSVKGHQNFIAGSGGVAGQVWGDAIEIVNQQFPEAVEDKRWPVDGLQPTNKLRVDSNKTEILFKIKWQTYETQLKNYLELLE